MAANAQSFKNVMARWATGISVITTAHNGEQQGFTANSLTSVSIDPLLISMSVAKTLYAGELILKSGIFAINILAADQSEVGQVFAGFSDIEDRFSVVQTHTLPGNDSPLIQGALAWMACKVYKKVDVGASTLILGEVTDCAHRDTGTTTAPLLYFNRQWGSFQAQG